MERHRIKVGKTEISVETAKDTLSIMRGLSGRPSLSPNDGMLFIFPRPKRYRFWMPDMHFPIDIIWINDDKVVDITESASNKFNPLHPKFYRPLCDANYVLEVNAGFSEEKGIKVGDVVDLDGASRRFVIQNAGPESEREWNKFVRENHPPIGAFLGSWEWSDFQKSLGWEVNRYLVKENDKLAAVFAVAKYPTFFGLSHAYTHRGPVIAKEYVDDEIANFEILRTIQSWARKNLTSVIFLRTEPSLSSISPDIEKYGFHRPSYYIQPRYNTAVPLGRSEEEIFAGFHSSTRSNLRRSGKRGATVEMKKELTDKDLKQFFSMVESTLKRNHGKNAYPDFNYLKIFFSGLPVLDPDKKYDPTKLSIGVFWGYQNGEPAAAHFVVFFGDTATYLFGASYADKLGSKIETSLHWAAMQEAKKLGMHYYDLGGVDERVWPTLTDFKRQFNGEEFQYVGNIDIPIHAGSYYLYNFLKKAKKKVRNHHW
jgi:uncharacterized membrane protein (UPF0127 family)/lipid II:glycine glycyltransferase (peptidoglycan interpeptide bridge formation enzyme)